MFRISILSFFICFSILASNEENFEFKSCKYSSYIKWYNKKKSMTCGKLTRIFNSNVQRKKEQFIQKKYKQKNYSKFMKHKLCISETFNLLRKNMDQKCDVLIKNFTTIAKNNPVCAAKLTKNKCVKFNKIKTEMEQDISLSLDDVSSGHKSYESHLKFKTCIDFKIISLDKLKQKLCKKDPKKKLWKSPAKTGVLKDVSFMCPPGRHLQGLNKGNPVCN